jgi:hypothetical protein
MVVLAALALALAAEPEFDPPRRFDVELTAFASTPERFSLCAGAHPGRPVEIDLCLSADLAGGALTSHVFYRKRWLFPFAEDPQRGVSLAFGPGVGVRAMRFCRFACAISGGPEALLSVEAVLWLTPVVGLTLQLDGGFAAVWAQSAPGVIESEFRFPARLLAGVAF